MTQEISFISAGEDEKEAISFLLKFVEEKFLELGSSPQNKICLLYTSPSPRDATLSRMPSSA